MSEPIDREVRIRVEMRNDLSRPAGEAEASIKQVGTQAEKTAAKLKILEEQQQATARSAQRAALAEAEYNRVMADSRSTDNDKLRALTQYDNAIKAHERNLAKVVQYGKRINAEPLDKYINNLKEISKYFDKFGKIGDFFAPWVKYGLMFLGVTQELAPALVAVMAGLTPLLGGLTALPSAMMSMVQIGAVGMIAFHGMGQTISDLTANIVDYNKVSQDMMNMAPAAQQFATQFSDLDKNVIRPMAQNIQQAFFENFNNAIPVLRNLVGIMSGPLQRTASTLGDALVSSLAKFQSGQNADDFTALMNGINGNIDSIIGGVDDLGSAFIHFMTLAQPFLNWMVEGFREGAQNIDRWVHSAQGTTTITNFFQKARSVMSGTWVVLKNIGVALHNVAKGASGFESYMGGGLVSLTQRFRDWTQSAKGQASINRWFQQAETIFKMLMGDLGKILPLLGKFSNDPRLANALTKIADAATKLVTTILNTGGVQFAIMIVVNALDLLATMVEKAPKPLKFLTGIVIGLAVAFNMLKLGAVVSAFASLLGLIPTLAAGLEVLTGGMVSFDVAADANPIGGIIILLLALGAAVAAVTYEVLMHWRGMMTGLKTAYNYTLAPMLRGIGVAINFIKDHWKLFAIGFATLIGGPILGGIVTLLTHLSQVRNFFKKLPGEIGGWLKNVGSLIARPFVAAFHEIESVWNRVAGKIPFIGKFLEFEGAGNATTSNAKAQAMGNNSWLSLNTLSSVLGGVGGAAASMFGKLTGKWAGGPVLENRPYLVGEKGPEWYQSGTNITPIGLHGPEIVSFANPGTIVPHHLYDRLLDEMAMSGAKVRQAMGDPSVTVTGPFGTGSTSQQIHVEGSDYQINVTAHDASDMRHQLKRLMKELRDEEEARRIHWDRG